MTPTPHLTLRDVRANDLAAVMGLNNTAGASILPMDGAQLDRFYRTADYFRVAEVDGHLAGFLVALRDSTAHVSSNFQWFRQHCEEFVYIDRVVIGDLHRGHGVSSDHVAGLQARQHFHAIAAALPKPHLAQCDAVGRDDVLLDGMPPPRWNGAAG